MDPSPRPKGLPITWGEGTRRLGASYDRALPGALAAASAIHVAALVVVILAGPVLFLVGPEEGPLAWLGGESEPMVVQLVMPGEGGASGGEPQAPARPEQAPPAGAAERALPNVTTVPSGIPAAEAPGAVAGAAGVPSAGGAYGAGSGSPGSGAAERLRPALQDARLWTPLDSMINALTPEQRIELELTGRIQEWQDSVEAAAAAASALTDWTRVDSKGRRWGVSPGALHLGDVTLPLPFTFGMPVGRRDELRKRAWVWEEITRGAASGEVRDSWKDRSRAIRERRDRERAQAKADTSRIR